MKFKKGVIVLVISIVVIFLGVFGYGIYMMIEKFEMIQEEALLNQTDKPDELIVYNYKSEQVDTLNLDGKVFIHFWATWCKPCLDEFDTFNKILENQETFKVYFISDEDTLVVKKFLSKSSWSKIPFYGSIKDRDKLHYSVLPTTYYSLNDSILKKVTGKYDWNSFFRKIEN